MITFERIARHIDALPEAVGAEQHAARVGFELIEQLRARRAVGLAVKSQLRSASQGESAWRPCGACRSW